MGSTVSAYYEHLSEKGQKLATELEGFVSSVLDSQQIVAFESEQAFTEWLETCNHYEALDNEDTPIGYEDDPEQYLPLVFRKLLADEGRVPVIRAATSLEAHNWCLCGDIQHGDVLLVESEGVVGIADAWPVAVTDVIGSFDYLGDALDQLPVGEVGFNMLSVDKAVELASERGYKLAPWVEVMLSSREEQQAAPVSRGPGM